ncbi:potassium channel family protein [Anaerorhabdus furcosa]|uniref:Voltage-gated potassium channel n=1 Tax=Anaerorhabdus furcosa TaxID=118967 RepID=A0A1T4LCE9_9FIRM|nr:potassium channel family protein [Anaerorhabdus furcosa]SJZ52472.1 voltage-gated potassium channel [Anaerorhabdus furcosa]
MKKVKLLWQVLRYTGTDKIVSGFIIFYFIATFLILITEPTITNYGDAMWFTFVTFTTIGYGEIVVNNLVARIITAFLALYGIIVVALIPGVLVSYFTEIKSVKQNDTVMQFLNKLERLPELTKEELEAISKNVKKQKYKL